NAVDVEEIAAVIGDEGIDQQYVGAQIDELSREIAADEPEAAGDHHPAAAVEIAMGHDHVRGEFGYARSAGSRAASGRMPARRCWRRITSSYQRRITSMPVLKMRGKLKNCDLPNARW